MKSADVRKKYIEFFVKRGHTEIPSAPLVPLNDPTTLFTGSGMQPMIPYLLGQQHPEGTRLVDSQKSFRSQDIDEAGDNRHTTFFEMLGNWSLGDYFKKEQIEWIFTFLTDKKTGIGLDPQRLYVSVFRGKAEINIPPDEEAVMLWRSMFKSVGIEAKVANFPEKNGMQDGRIFYYDETKNWWSRVGVPANMPVGEPGGPDSEVFYDFGEERKLHENSPWKNEPCHVNCDCGRFMEIANNVFMTYKRTDAGYEPLTQKNIDFGGGLERLVAATNDDPDVFKTDLFRSLIETIESLSKKKYGEDEQTTRAMRILSDHIKGAIMMMVDGVMPSNKLQGYVLRRLIRRSLLYGRNLGIAGDWKYVGELVEPIAAIYKDAYPEVLQKAFEIKSLLEEEAVRFGKSLEKGLREIEKIEKLDGTNAFKLYETFGFPWEMTEEIARDRGQTVEKGEFEIEFKKHQDKSRSSAKGMFKGGLADHSEQTIKLHTTHHLLLAALQKIVDPTIKQRGSNITAERLRIDFNLNRALTPEEKEKVEELVNQKIKEDLPMTKYMMKKEDAEKIGAQMEFGYKYPEQVNVYIIGLKSGVKPENATLQDYFSAEFCGGPHVEHTGVIGHFKIIKEEAMGAGIRRIYASIS